MADVSAVSGLVVPMDPHLLMLGICDTINTAQETISFLRNVLHQEIHSYQMEDLGSSHGATVEVHCQQSAATLQAYLFGSKLAKEGYQNLGSMGQSQRL